MEYTIGEAEVLPNLSPSHPKDQPHYLELPDMFENFVW